MEDGKRQCWGFERVKEELVLSENRRVNGLEQEGTEGISGNAYTKKY